MTTTAARPAGARCAPWGGRTARSDTAGPSAGSRWCRSLCCLSPCPPGAGRWRPRWPTPTAGSPAAGAGPPSPAPISATARPARTRPTAATSASWRWSRWWPCWCCWSRPRWPGTGSSACSRRASPCSSAGRTPPSPDPCSPRTRRCPPGCWSTAPRCCSAGRRPGCTHGAGCPGCWPRPRRWPPRWSGAGWPSGWRSSPRPGPRPWTAGRRSCAGSSATSTTARRPGWWRWAWPWAPSRRCSTPIRNGPASWCGRPGRAPPGPSPSCGTWCAASILRCSPSAAWWTPCGRWPWTRRWRPRSTRTASPAARRARSRPRCTSPSPSC